MKNVKYEIVNMSDSAQTIEVPNYIEFSSIFTAVFFADNSVINTIDTCTWKKVYTQTFNPLQLYVHH